MNEEKPVYVTRKEYDAMTKEDRKRYYWHNGKACLKKIDLEYHQRQLRQAKLNAATAIANHFERLARKTKMRVDQEMYLHVARLVKNWRDSHHVERKA